MRSQESKQSSSDLKDSLPLNDVTCLDALPLSDVRGMANRVQSRPTPATPPFQQNRHALANNVRPGTATRLPESRTCDEILSADTDDNDDHVSYFL